MMDSVPSEKRNDFQFEKAMSLMTHIFIARQRWLHRIGKYPAADGGSDIRVTTIPELLQLKSMTETSWSEYLLNIGDQELGRVIEYRRVDGTQRVNTLEDILTHLCYHGMYHRGQIVLLVNSLGGNVEDTDYIYWVGQDEF